MKFVYLVGQTLTEGGVVVNKAFRTRESAEEYADQQEGSCWTVMTVLISE